MRRFFYIAIFTFCTLFFYGQNLSVEHDNDHTKAPGIYLPDGTKVNEYKKTFEIKDVPNPDNSALSKIDMSRYWKFMHVTNRVEVLDDVTGLTLILYSHSESKAFIDFNTALIVMPNDHIRGESKSP